MLRPHGYCKIDGGPEGLVEEDTIRCVHCQKIGFVQRGGQVLWPQLHMLPQEHYTCRQCHAPICPSCANKPCVHFEKWLERVQKRGNMRSRLSLERMEEVAYRALQKAE